MHRKLAYGGITLALAYILSFIDVIKLPQGGGVSLESLPLVLFAFLFGPRAGFVLGFAYGLLLFTKTPVIFHPLQFFLDYPLAFSACFLAGYFRRTGTFFWAAPLPFFVLRFFFHTLSGVLFIRFFLRDVPEHVLIYVLGYNASYLIPTMILCTALFSPAAKRLGMLAAHR